jgi:hypothetical protein
MKPRSRSGSQNNIYAWSVTVFVLFSMTPTMVEPIKTAFMHPPQTNTKEPFIRVTCDRQKMDDCNRQFSHCMYVLGLEPEECNKQRNSCMVMSGCRK